MTEIENPESSSQKQADWSPAALQAKLQDRLEAAFSKHFHPADKCPGNKLYLAILLRTHFRLEQHVAQELAEHTTTIRELLDQLTGLLCPGTHLFDQKSEASSQKQEADCPLLNS